MARNYSALEQFHLAAKAIRFVCQFFGCHTTDLEGPSRKWREKVWPRWLAIWLVKSHTGYSNAKLALLFDRRPSSISKALAGLANELETNAERWLEAAELGRKFLNYLNPHTNPQPNHKPYERQRRQKGI